MTSQQLSDTLAGPSNRHEQAVLQHRNARYYGPSYISGGTTIIGDNFGTIASDEAGLYLDRQRLLQSLRYPEINARFNEIKDSHYQTFQWIFSEETFIPTEHNLELHSTEDLSHDSEWDHGYLDSEGRKKQSRTRAASRLMTWLRGSSDEPLTKDTFFVQGKAGSGKSTFMKFIFQHSRTSEILHTAYKNQEVTMLFHSFWLPGTKLQNSYKGFVASLIYQLLTRYPVLLEQCQKSPGQSHKLTLSDWSEKDLCTLLLTNMKESESAICLFIDGLDEYDNEDDFDRLLTLFKQIRASAPKCKFCVSSRPVRHIVKSLEDLPGLRLQSLTYDDIESFVRSTLEEKLPFDSTADTQNKLLNLIVREICRKADGVFLWAHYVLRSVCGGLRIGDDLNMLLKRIEVLPSAILDLYHHMWVSQANDNKVHGEEAAKMFSFGKLFPMPVFRLMVATDTALQQHYLMHVSTIDEAYLDKSCKEFAKRLSVRSAGLIECVVRTKYRKGICKPPFMGPTTIAEMKPGSSSETVHGWRDLDAQYFHRSVHDFLTGTEEGQLITYQHQKSTTFAVPEANFLSYLAGCIEGLEDLDLHDLHVLSSSLPNSVTTLRTLYQCRVICDRLWQKHMEMHPHSDHGWVHRLQREGDEYDSFEVQNCELDDTGLLLVLSYAAGVERQMFGNQYHAWSAYYKGYLSLCLIQAYTAKTWHNEDVFLAYKSIVSWMVDVGADAVTPHSIWMVDIHFAQTGPVIQILSQCLRFLMSRHWESMSAGSARALLALLLMLRGYADFFACNDLSFIMHGYTFLWKQESSSLSHKHTAKAVYMIATFNAHDILEIMIGSFRAVSLAGEEVSYVYSALSPVEAAEISFRRSCLALPYQLNVLRHALDTTYLVEAVRLSKREDQIMRDMLSSVMGEGCVGVPHSLPEQLFELLKDSTWTQDLPQVQDLHFMLRAVRPEMVPLDPFAEASSRDWKKACSLRHYFSELDIQDSAERKPDTSSIPTATDRLELALKRDNQSSSRSSNRFLQRIRRLGKQKG